MKKIMTAFVILAFAVMAMGQGIDDMTSKGAGSVDKDKGPINQTATKPMPTAISQPGPQGPEGPMGPEGPRGPRGEKGEPGQRIVKVQKGRRGPQGPRGPAGTANHLGIDRDIKSWNPAGVGLVQRENAQQDIRLKKWASEHFVRKSFLLAAGIPATTASLGGTTAVMPGGNDMYGWDPLSVIIVVALLILLATGHWIWGNLVHNRGLHDENRAQSQGFDPHQRIHSVFYTETTKQKSVLKATPSDVAIAQSQAEAEIAHCRMTEAAVARQARQAERQALLAMIVQPAPAAQFALAGGGYALGLPGGGTGATPPAANAEKVYTAKELKELGVIKPATPAKEPDGTKKDTEEAKKKGPTVKT